MLDFPGRADERDEAFVFRLRQGADHARMSYREWIQQELKELRIELQVLEATGTPVGGALKTLLDRIDELDRDRLREIDLKLDDRLREITDGGYDNVLDAAHLLAEAVLPFEGLVRELLKAREFVIQQRGFAVPEA